MLLPHPSDAHEAHWSLYRVGVKPVVAVNLSRSNQPAVLRQQEDLLLPVTTSSTTQATSSHSAAGFIPDCRKLAKTKWITLTAVSREPLNEAAEAVRRRSVFQLHCTTL